MNKCFMTKRNRVVNNPSINKVGELRLPCVGSLGKSFDINKNRSSIVYFDRNDIVAEIISSDNVTFTDGTTTLKGSTEQLVSKSIQSDKNIVLSLTPKYYIKAINFVTENTTQTMPTESNFNLSTLGIIPNLENLYIHNGFLGNIDLLLKNAKSLVSLDVSFSNVDFSISSISNKLKSLSLVGVGKVKGTIAEVAKIVNLKDWGQCMNQSSIEGDLADVPSDVFYVNLPSKAVTWTKGKRNTGSILAINVNFESTQQFASHKDVDNMFVDQSTCTLDTNPSNNTHGGAIKKINIYCPDNYTPSSEAQAAIRTLYGKGLTNIIVNGKEMDAYK